MTTYTKQEFYSTGDRGIVSRTVNGKSLSESVQIVVDDHWNGNNEIKVCRVSQDSSSYQDAEGLIKNQKCGIPITANSLCLSCDSDGNYSFGEVDSNAKNITINNQTKEISDWRSDGTKFIQDTKVIWSSALDSSIVGYEEYDPTVIKIAWRSADHSTGITEVTNVVDDNGSWIPYFPEAIYKIKSIVINNFDFSPRGELKPQSDNNKFMQWRNNSPMDLQAIKYTETLPDGYLILFLNQHNNMFEYENIRNGNPLYDANGEQVPWNENAHVVRYMSNHANWTIPSGILYAYNNNGYIGIYYNSSYVLTNVSMFVISIAPIE